MERLYYLGGAAGAGILSFASVDNPMIWAWLLIAAQVAACALLRKQSESQAKPVPVPSRERRPIRRAPPSPWR
jgi:hypothetical protein